MLSAVADVVAQLSGANAVLRTDDSEPFIEKQEVVVAAKVVPAINIADQTNKVASEAILNREELMSRVGGDQELIEILASAFRDDRASTRCCLQ